MAQTTRKKEIDIQFRRESHNQTAREYRKAQQKERLQELEVDYTQNLKRLQKIAAKAHRLFVNRTQQAAAKKPRTLHR